MESGHSFQQAQVKWLAPEKLSAYLDKMYQWASGDGESGVHARYYWRYVQQLGIWLVFSLLVAVILAGVLIWKPAPTLLWAGVVLPCLVGRLGWFIL